MKMKEWYRESFKTCVHDLAKGALMFKIICTHHSTVSSFKGDPKGVDQSHCTSRVRTNDDISTVTQTDERIDISLVRVC